jgi:hypothetical protein
MCAPRLGRARGVEGDRARSGRTVARQAGAETWAARRPLSAEHTSRKEKSPPGRTTIQTTSATVNAVTNPPLLTNTRSEVLV